MDDAIVRLVFLKLRRQPLAKSVPVGRTDALRTAAQQAHIPHLSLVPRVTWIGQQLVNQQLAFLRISVAQKCGCFLVGRNHADQVEIDPPQEHRIRRRLQINHIQSPSNGIMTVFIGTPVRAWKGPVARAHIARTTAVVIRHVEFGIERLDLWRPALQKQKIPC